MKNTIDLLNNILSDLGEVERFSTGWLKYILSPKMTMPFPFPPEMMEEFVRVLKTEDSYASIQMTNPGKLAKNATLLRFLKANFDGADSTVLAQCVLQAAIKFLSHHPASLLHEFMMIHQLREALNFISNNETKRDHAAILLQQEEKLLTRILTIHSLLQFRSYPVDSINQALSLFDGENLAHKKAALFEMECYRISSESYDKENTFNSDKHEAQKLLLIPILKNIMDIGRINNSLKASPTYAASKSKDINIQSTSISIKHPTVISQPRKLSNSLIKILREDVRKNDFFANDSNVKILKPNANLAEISSHVSPQASPPSSPPRSSAPFEAPGSPIERVDSFDDQYDENQDASFNGFGEHQESAEVMNYQSPQTAVNLSVIHEDPNENDVSQTQDSENREETKEEVVKEEITLFHGVTLQDINRAQRNISPAVPNSGLVSRKSSRAPSVVESVNSDLSNDAGFTIESSVFATDFIKNISEYSKRNTSEQRKVEILIALIESVLELYKKIKSSIPEGSSLKVGILSEKLQGLQKEGLKKGYSFSYVYPILYAVLHEIYSSRRNANLTDTSGYRACIQDASVTLMKIRNIKDRKDLVSLVTGSLLFQELILEKANEVTHKSPPAIKDERRSREAICANYLEAILYENERLLTIEEEYLIVNALEDYEKKNESRPFYKAIKFLANTKLDFCDDNKTFLSTSHKAQELERRLCDVLLARVGCSLINKYKAPVSPTKKEKDLCDWREKWTKKMMRLSSDDASAINTVVAHGRDRSNSISSNGTYKSVRTTMTQGTKFSRRSVGSHQNILSPKNISVYAFQELCARYEDQTIKPNLKPLAEDQVEYILKNINAAFQRGDFDLRQLSLLLNEAFDYISDLKLPSKSMLQFQASEPENFDSLISNCISKTDEKIPSCAFALYCVYLQTKATEEYELKPYELKFMKTNKSCLESPEHREKLNEFLKIAFIGSSIEKIQAFITSESKRNFSWSLGKKN